MQVKKPKILFLCDKRDWAYATVAHNLSTSLKDEFSFSIKYVNERPSIVADKYDIIYVFWWGERYHRLFVEDSTIVVKEISSHRWQYEAQYGKHTPNEALDRYLNDCSCLVATSDRLYKLYYKIHPHIYHYRLGVNTNKFYPYNNRSGQIKFGWAGNPKDNTKGLYDIILPACGQNFTLQCANGDIPYEKMADFYNSIDVILVASESEGTPLPLIEAMACGCFPVTTDVGVACEIIDNKKNGLIIERTVEAFKNSFEWCSNNKDIIRENRINNSKIIQNYWSIEASAKKFSNIINSILIDKNKYNKTGSVMSNNTDKYSIHFERINPGTTSESAYQSAIKTLKEDVLCLLPLSKDARIIEIGTGYGHLLRFLIENGYKRVCGIDISQDLFKSVKYKLADKLELFLNQDAINYFKDKNKEFDCIVMLDMIEHLKLEEALLLLTSINKALKPDGRLIIRTPNMSNLLGCYSRYMDLTHLHCYTEWSIIHALERCNFNSPKLLLNKKRTSIKNIIFSIINNILHRFLYIVNDRVIPKCFDKNLIVYADRTD